MCFDESVGRTDLNGTNLFSPIRVGGARLRHRVVVPPLNKVEAMGYVPGRRSLAAYYGEMSQIPGTLAIVESTVFTSPDQGVADDSPCSGPLDPAAGWGQVFGRIHSNHSYVFVQLCNLAESAEAAELAAALDSVSLDAVSLDASNHQRGGLGTGPSRAIIAQFVQQYVELARSAILTGADGVEIHHVEGSLLNHFLDPEANKRTDEYGRSIENRARLTLEVVDALVGAIGAERVAICFSPYASGSHFLTVAQHAYVLGELERRSRHGSPLAYVHLEEPSTRDLSMGEGSDPHEGATSFLYSIWKGPVIRAGSLTLHPELIQALAENDRTLIADGQFFISNLNIGLEMS